MNDSDSGQGLEGLQAALAARSMVKSWAEGLELVELVHAAHRAGWLGQLRGETTAAELAATTGVPVEQASDVLAVLASAGLAGCEGVVERVHRRLQNRYDGVAGEAVTAIM